jgi:hypothetical protein
MTYISSLRDCISDSTALTIILSIFALAATHACLVEMGLWRKKLDVNGKVGLAVFEHALRWTNDATFVVG